MFDSSETRKWSFFFSICIIFLFSAPDSSWAWGTIQGVVRSNTGSPLSNAIVKTDIVTLLTWKDGTFQMYHPAGTYNVSIAASGYLPQTSFFTVTDSNTTILPDFFLFPAPAPVIKTVSPSLGEVGEKLTMTIQGSGFDTNTRLSMYPDTGNRNKIIGSLDTEGNAYDVTVIGNTAYVADGTYGLRVVDVSDPTNPKTIEPGIDFGGNAKAVTVIEDIAYVASEDGGLKVIDVSVPSDPQWIGQAGYSVNDVFVTGNLVYAAGYPALKVIDINAPTGREVIGSVEFTDTGMENSEGITVVGNFAYVVGYAGWDRYTSFLLVIDISAPEDPDIVGSVETPEGYGYDVEVIGDIAYVANSDAGLLLIDVSVPTAPKIIRSVDTPGNAYSIKVIDDAAFVADGANGLVQFDISDPGHPTIIGSVDTPGSALGLAVIGDMSYVADDNSGLKVVNINDPSPPAIVGLADTPGNAQSVTVIDDIAYVADYDSGLQIVDVSDPANPELIGSVDTQGFALDVSVNGDFAYVADYDSGLQVVDVSDLTTPQIISTLITPGYVRAVSVSGDIAYVADGELQVVDISNPANPVIISSWSRTDYFGYAYGVTVVGEIAYVAYFSGLEVIDVSDPFHPVSMDGISTMYSFDVTVVGDIAYVSCNDDNGGFLLIVDVSIPTDLKKLGSIDTPGDPKNVTIDGNTAYVATWEDGVQVVDISDPSEPLIIGSYNIGGYTSYVDVLEGLLYICADDLIIGMAPVEISALVTSDTEITVMFTCPLYQGNYTIRSFNNVKYSELPGAVTFTNNADILHARAVIVAGGGPDAPGEIWEETKSYAREAYNSLLFQGYTEENIYYLTDDAAAEGRDAAANRANLEYALTTWAMGDPDTKSLVVYLVDHGEKEQFLLRGNADPDHLEYVNAEEIDSWLDILQLTSAIKVLFVYDACFSGSFVSKLREQMDTRIIITSVDDEEVAHFLDLKQSFSGVFWGTLSGKTGTRGNLYNAWSLASGNMAFHQAAQLDANGNGVANEPEDVDALEQNIFEIGREWFNAGFSRPVVNIIASDQTLAGETGVELSARGIYDLDRDDIVRVWAEVIAPDYVPSANVTITSLPTIELIDSNEDGVYKATCPGDPVNCPPGFSFDKQGTYIINYYAEDSSGIYSQPRTSLVTQSIGTSVSIPDLYEDDDTANDAGVIVLNDPSPQDHSFHDPDDEDWVKFYGLAGEVYSVKAMNPAIISDPGIEIYSSNNLITPIISSNTVGIGSEEFLKNWTCPADGLYYVRIVNNSGHYGANVRYKLKVYNPIAFSLPGHVKGKITSGGKGVAGAVIQAGGGTAITLSDGSFVLCLKPGSYSVSVSCDGYQSTSFSVNLDSGQSVSLTRDMNSVPRILNFPATRIKVNEEYSYVPSVSDVDGDPLTFSIAGVPSWANFSAANGRLWGRPGFADQGIYGPITIKVTDNAGASDSVTFTLKVEQGKVGSLPGVLLLLQGKE